MSLHLQPVQVAAGGNDTEGHLVLCDGFLVAAWFLEAGFGRLDIRCPPTFADLDEAQDWITRQLGKLGSR